MRSGCGRAEPSPPESIRCCGPHYEGYRPLGQGKVDIAGVCDLLDKSGNDLVIMAELDPSKGMPLTPLEAARINKETLVKLGYVFRT